MWWLYTFLSTNIEKIWNSKGLYIFVRSRNNETVIGAKLRATIVRNSGSISERVKVFSLRQSFQTDNGTNPLYCTTAYRVSVLLRWSGRCVNVTTNPNLGPGKEWVEQNSTLPWPSWLSQEQSDFYINAYLKSVKDIFPNTYRQVPKEKWS